MITQNGFKIAINRIAKDTPDYLEITKVKFGTDQGEISISATDLTKPVPFSKYAVVHNCDVTTNWSGTYAQSLVSLNTTTYKEGTGSLNIYKTSATSNVGLGIKNSTLTSRDATGRYVSFWVYFADQATLDKFSEAGFRYGSSTANYYHTTFSATVGWTNIRALVSSMSTTGTPNIAACTYFDIILTLITGTDTIAAGKIILDDIYLIENANLIADIDTGYPVIDEINSTATYRGTLSTAQGNGFLVNSFATFNEDATVLMQDIFKFPSISKSTSDEIIIEFRNRLVRR